VDGWTDGQLEAKTRKMEYIMYVCEKKKKTKREETRHLIESSAVRGSGLFPGVFTLCDHGRTGNDKRLVVLDCKWDPRRFPIGWHNKG
jgi:hypothetical protein